MTSEEYKTAQELLVGQGRVLSFVDWNDFLGSIERAYPIIGLPGPLTVGFTEEMTEEEAKKKFGSGVLLIPGTEREVD